MGLFRSLCLTLSLVALVAQSAWAGPSPTRAALGRLPQETLAVMVVEGLAPLLKVLGRAKLLKTMPVFMGKVRAEWIRGIGVDALDPEALRAAGVDVHAPMGLALLDIELETWVVFVAIHDRVRVEAWVRRVVTAHGETVEAEDVGEARLLRFSQSRGVELLLTQDQALLVWSQGDVRRVARSMAAETRGLAADPRVSEALGHLARPTLVWAYLNTWALGEQVIAEIGSSYAERNLVRRVRRLEATGPPSALAAARAALKAARPGLMDQAKRAAARRLVRGVFNMFGGLALGLWTEGPHVLVEAALSVRKDTLPDRVLRVGAEVDPLFTTTRAPILFGALTLEPTVVHDFVRLLVTGTSGASEWAQMDAQTREILGWDMAGLAQRLSGSLSVVGLVEPIPNRDQHDAGGSLALGFKRPEDAQSFVDVVVRETHQPAPVDGRATVGIPYWRMAVLAAVGPSLVLTTHAPVLDRLKVAGPGFRQEMKDPALRTLLTRSGASGVGGVALGAWFLVLADIEPPEAVLGTAPAPPEGSMEDPKTRAAVRARLDHLVARRELRQAAATKALGEALGTAAVRIEKANGVVRVEGGLFLDVPTVSTLVERLAHVYQEETDALSDGYVERAALRARLGGDR